MRCAAVLFFTCCYSPWTELLKDHVSYSARSFMLVPYFCWNLRPFLFGFNMYSLGMSSNQRQYQGLIKCCKNIYMFSAKVVQFNIQTTDHSKGPRTQLTWNLLKRHAEASKSELACARPAIRLHWLQEQNRSMTADLDLVVWPQFINDYAWASWSLWDEREAWWHFVQIVGCIDTHSRALLKSVRGYLDFLVELNFVRQEGLPLSPSMLKQLHACQGWTCGLKKETYKNIKGTQMDFCGSRMPTDGLISGQAVQMKIFSSCYRSSTSGPWPWGLSGELLPHQGSIQSLKTHKQRHPLQKKGWKEQCK